MHHSPEVLKNFLRDSGLSYAENSVSYIFTCPRCDKKKRLYIHKQSWRFICFYCATVDNFKGRVEYALSSLLNRPAKEIAAELYGTGNVPVEAEVGFNLRDWFGEGEEEVEAKPPEEVAWPVEYLAISDPRALAGAQYLKSRGIGLRLASQYGIHYDPIRSRVAFPVQAAGKLYGWQARTILPTEFVDPQGVTRTIPKILSSKGIPRSQTLMFVDRLQGHQHAVLCEGPVDSIKAHYCGGNVAAMGKQVTKGQIELLKNAGIQKLYLALDPDASSEMGNLFRSYSDDFQIYTMLAAGGKKDLGEMGYGEVFELFLNAKPIPTGRLFVYLRTPHSLLGAC